MTSMFVFLAFLGLHSGFKQMCEASDLPGLKIRLSKKGLDYGW